MWIQETLYDGCIATKMAFCRVLLYCDNFCGILMLKKIRDIFMEDTLCEGNVKMDTQMKSSLLYCFSFCIFYVILL